MTNLDRQPVVRRGSRRESAAGFWLVAVTVVLTAVLLAGGIASLIYGARYHTAPVSEEQEIEISIAPPPGFGQLRSGPTRP